MSETAFPLPISPLCEHCYGPIFASGYASGAATDTYVAADDWPGTQGVRVYFHVPCYGEARTRRGRRTHG